MTDIDSATARRAALNAASGFPPAFTEDVDGAAAFIRAVGYIQIDTISVVARSHEHVLWNRSGHFSPDPFRTLQAFDVENASSTERRIFEYWAHAAAYLPIEDYRFCRSRMERIRRDGHEWFRADPAVTASVLERVRAEGPLSSKDFEDPRGKAGTWWDWKPAKRALEYLFQAGELMVGGRRGFAKVFDLPERVLSAELDLSPVGAQESARWLVDRASRAYGIFTAAEAVYGRRDQIGLVPAEIAERLSDGRLLAVRLPHETKNGYCLEPSTLAAAASGDRSERIEYFILSPFDPFIIDRKRIFRLFNFDYALECYLPQAKRKFGYFALPILAVHLDSGGHVTNGSFHGLLDAKADRKVGVLRVKKLALSPEADKTAFAAALRAFAEFNGCAEVALANIDTYGPSN